MVQKKKAASAARKRTKAVDSGTPASIITSLNVSILMFSALGAFQLINQTFDLKQMIVFASIILQGLAMCFFWRRIDSHLKVISGFTYILTTWLFLIGTAAKDLLPIASMVPSLGLIGITITSLILLTVWMLDNRSAPTIVGGIFGAVLIASTFLQQDLDLSIDSSSMINLSAKSPDDETIMASDMDAYSYEPMAKSKRPEEDKRSSYLTKIKSQIREIGSKVPEIISKSKAKDTKLISQPATKQARWAYTGKNGPRYWAQLNPEFRLCSSGREQSPISIPNNWDLMKELRTFYKPTPYKIHYSKNGVRVTLPQGPQSYMNKELFQAKKLSFHTPSEHLYQGHSFPVEIQIHHRNKQGKFCYYQYLRHARKA